ncbi:hypothetical protein [Trujillonella endophytica]|uniref:Uncharacterized protein n=1 Tax=Trujillonella endophytica TaxID=673521 RepID=A0A1H8VUL7_9ACTN|nr:hypothetical protein [Trujillella endophytica]SEP19132.1 hypothetical protein SAMN05660991_03786 [Trujillella endophytica]
METQFTRSGPGQSWRLAYQILGSDGSIPNPRGIRYIAPGSAEAEGLGLPSPARPLPPLPADASAVMGAVQLANLGIGVVNLAISTAVLVEVKKQTRMLRELQVGLTEVRAGVSDILERTERIDLNVAEVQLRETLKHALRSAAKDHEVDLVLLTQLVRGALGRFFESIGGPLGPGTKRDLTLSSDVREMAEAALHLLWAARLTAIEAHNRSCGGDPLQVVRDDGVQNRLRTLADTAALVAATGVAKQMAKRVSKDLRSNRLFFGRADGVLRVMDEHVARLDTSLNSLGPVPQARSLLAELEDQEVLVEARKVGADAVSAVLGDYLLAWTAHTDAGLLWRLCYELDLQDDGTYWRGLEGWMTALMPGAADSPLGISRGVPEPVG